MNPKLKRILLIIGFIAVAVFFGYLIYRILFSPIIDTNDNDNYNVNGILPNINAVNRPTGNINDNLNVNEALPNINGTAQPEPPSQVASGGITEVSKITEDLTKSAVIDTNKKDLIYYDELTGEFIKTSPDGTTKTKLTDDKYPGAEDIYWSPSRDKAVITFPDRSKITYDFNLKKQYSLPKETYEFSFSPSSGKLAYKYQGEQEGDNYLAVSDPEGTSARLVEDLGQYANQVTVNWAPNNQVIATYNKSTSTEEQEIIFLGANNENFPSVDVSGRGFKSKWSPTGNTILYSVFDKESNYNPSLHIMDGTMENIGASQVDLNIQTWPDKCVFGDNNYIYCAVPEFLPSGSDIYPELANNVPDDFYKINLETGSKELLARPVNSSGFGNYTAQNVYLSNNEEYIYFTDKNTGRVYKIRLK
ncbi:MAG: hypothetical protein U5L76_00085 [Patescibacteria group bacterium]|nr:hypothetical protein [Patescibacteria group bacterium]MDZ7798001.1 hypothetical protein [Patescibacteria group bacterium]